MSCEWINLAREYGPVAGYCEHGDEPSLSIKGGHLLHPLVCEIWLDRKFDLALVISEISFRVRKYVAEVRTSGIPFYNSTDGSLQMCEI
jgi:hypothetical protein